jgi:hypothetical protein
MKKLQLCAAILLLTAIQLAAITISPLPYGINVHLAQDETLAKVKAAGIAWIRIDINWNVIETSKGKFYYSEVDRVVNYATANGLSIYASIGSTPGWANGKKGSTYPATNVADWKNFVSRIIARYKSQIKYWGIWNEPNLKIFFAPGKDIFVQQVLLPAAQTIRGADPAAFIVGPDLSHKTETGSEWYFWMKYILDNAGGYFDIISHHIYEDLGVYYMYELLEQGDQFIPAVKTIIQESGQGNKPFWITETGWNTNKYSETMQANRYLDMLHTRARKNYPQKVFFYVIIDDPNPSIDPFGILRSNREAKPAYNVYKDYIAGLYPDPGNPDEGKINKKCFAEQNVNNGAPAARNPALQKMRQTSDFLRGYSASAQKTVDIYYDLNEEFMKIALADSRVFKLGREILEQAEILLVENGWIDMNRPFPETIYRNAKDLIGILKTEYLDTPLAPLALLADKNLALIGRMPLHDLLEFYLKEDIQGFKKIH